MKRQSSKRLLAGHILAVVVLVALWLALADGSSVAKGAPHTPADAPVVHILGPAHPPGLDPYVLTIHEGDTVTFVNNASPQAVHSVIAEDGSFASPPLQPGSQWMTSGFAHQGSHIYHDPTAYAQVVGIIIVVPQSTALQSTAAPGSVATVVARAKAAREGSSNASPSFAGLPLWSFVLVVLGLGGLAYFYYRYGRRRRGTKTRAR